MNYAFQSMLRFKRERRERNTTIIKPCLWWSRQRGFISQVHINEEKEMRVAVR